MISKKAFLCFAVLAVSSISFYSGFNLKEPNAQEIVFIDENPDENEKTAEMEEELEEQENEEDEEENILRAHFSSVKPIEKEQLNLQQDLKFEEYCGSKANIFYNNILDFYSRVIAQTQNIKNKNKIKEKISSYIIFKVDEKSLAENKCAVVIEILDLNKKEVQKEIFNDEEIDEKINIDNVVKLLSMEQRARQKKAQSCVIEDLD